MLRSTFGLFINLVVVSGAYAQEPGAFTGKVVSPDGQPIEVTVTLPDYTDGKPLGESGTDTKQGTFRLSVRELPGRANHRDTCQHCEWKLQATRQRMRTDAI